MAQLKLFLSHLSVEAKLADMLSTHLQQDFIGLVQVFVSSDMTSLPVGTNWLEGVMTAIETSQMHLILCSPESIKRVWIHYEAGAARARHVPTAPLCHSGLSSEQLPVPLSESEAVQLDAHGFSALYSSIAALLGSSVPNIDFNGYAREVATVENEFTKERTAARDLGAHIEDKSIVIDPRVVCVSSPQFLALGYANQIDIVLEAFPADLVHKRITTAAQLEEVLTDGEPVDVVHIAAFVCPRTGDLYFSEVDLNTGLSTVSEPDILPADALAALLISAKTRLVVVGSCESLVLAAFLQVTNVVATSDMISPQMMASWVTTFYRNLRNQTVASAFQIAKMTSRAPMRIFSRGDLKMMMNVDQ